MSSLTDSWNKLVLEFKDHFSSEKKREELLKQIISVDKFHNVSQGIITGLVYAVGATIGVALVSTVAMMFQVIAAATAIYFALKTYGEWDDKEKRNELGILAISATALCLLPGLLSLAPIAVIGLMLYRIFQDSIKETLEKAKPALDNAVKYCHSFFEPKTPVQKLSDAVKDFLP